MLSKFKKGVPILESELINWGSSKQDIEKLVESGELRKYDLMDGIYYINEPFEFMDFKTDTIILPASVVEKLYIGDNCEYGFYYDMSLLNKMGLCTQVPNILSIMSVNVDKECSLELDGMLFKVYPFRDIFSCEFNEKDILKYVVTLVENKYKGYLDLSELEYENKLKEWNLQNFKVNIGVEPYKI